jgi:hypothetical protein
MEGGVTEKAELFTSKITLNVCFSDLFAIAERRVRFPVENTNSEISSVLTSSGEGWHLPRRLTAIGSWRDEMTRSLLKSPTSGDRKVTINAWMQPDGIVNFEELTVNGDPFLHEMLSRSGSDCEFVINNLK